MAKQLDYGLDSENNQEPTETRSQKFKATMMHAITMMIGNEMELEFGGEVGEIPFYSKEMVRGPG